MYYDVLGVVRYEGTSGTVYVLTVRPSAGVLSRGLDLGMPLGTRSDSASLSVWRSPGESPSATVQYFRNGLIIQIAGDLPIEQLKALADTVTSP
jgi:predicted metalloprotease with PDZ domain